MKPKEEIKKSLIDDATYSIDYHTRKLMEAETVMQFLDPDYIPLQDLLTNVATYLKDVDWTGKYPSDADISFKTESGEELNGDDLLNKVKWYLNPEAREKIKQHEFTAEDPVKEESNA